MKHVTTSFYVPKGDIQNGIAHFSRGESNHLSRVLRARADDLVRVVDGEGGAFWAKVTRSDPEYSRAEIIEETEPAPEPSITFELAPGIIHPNRLESAWDSAIQLGARRLQPLRTKYSEERLKPGGKYMKRLRTVSVRGMKQSGRAVLPVVEEPMELNEYLQHTGDVLLYGNPEGLPSPPKERPRLGEKVSLLVGPEGGFSSEEIRLIDSAGGVPISMGPRRLRAETALVTLTVIALRWTGDI